MTDKEIKHLKRQKCLEPYFAHIENRSKDYLLGFMNGVLYTNDKSITEFNRELIQDFVKYLGEIVNG